MKYIIFIPFLFFFLFCLFPQRSYALISCSYTCTNICSSGNCPSCAASCGYCTPNMCGSIGVVCGGFLNQTCINIPDTPTTAPPPPPTVPPQTPNCNTGSTCQQCQSGLCRSVNAFCDYTSYTGGGACNIVSYTQPCPVTSCPQGDFCNQNNFCQANAPTGSGPTPTSIPGATATPTTIPNPTAIPTGIPSSTYSISGKIQGFNGVAYSGPAVNVVLNNGVKSVTTSNTYQFTGLAAGTYTVSLQNASTLQKAPPTGYYFSNPTSGTYTVTVGSGQCSAPSPAFCQ